MWAVRARGSTTRPVTYSEPNSRAAHSGQYVTEAVFLVRVASELVNDIEAVRRGRQAHREQPARAARRALLRAEQRGPSCPSGPGAAAVAVQGIATGIVTTNSEVYVPLLDGPSATVTIPASGKLLVILTAEVSGSSASNNDPISTGFMSVSLTNSVALDANSLRVTGDIPVRASITVLITNLTPGVTITFSARYKNVNLGAALGSARFNARQIIVIPA